MIVFSFLYYFSEMKSSRTWPTLETKACSVHGAVDVSKKPTADLLFALSRVTRMNNFGHVVINDNGTSGLKFELDLMVYKYKNGKANITDLGIYTVGQKGSLKYTPGMEETKLAAATIYRVVTAVVSVPCFCYHVHLTWQWYFQKYYEEAHN